MSFLTLTGRLTLRDMPLTPIETKARTIKEAIEEFPNHLHIMLSVFLECVLEMNLGDLKRLNLTILL